MEKYTILEASKLIGISKSSLESRITRYKIPTTTKKAQFKRHNNDGITTKTVKALTAEQIQCLKQQLSQSSN